MSTTEQAVRIETGAYGIDAVHSQVGFEVKHLGISTFRGSFGGFAGTINPEGTFRSTSIEKVDGENYKVTGDLTLRGTTNPVVLDVEVEGAGIGMDGSSVLSLKADGIVNRNDYGISWGAALDSGAAVVAEKVRIVLTVEAVKAAA